MYRIGILSRPGRKLMVTRAEIHKNFSFEVKSYTNAFRAAVGLKQREYDALVMVADEFGTTQAEVVYQIKKRFPELPLVVLATETDQDIKARITEYKKTIVLDEKSEIQDISGVLYKLLMNQPVFTRSTKRFKTNQAVSLHNNETQSIHPSWLFNLANKGAQMRVFGRSLKVGENVKLKVYLPEIKKEHTIRAEVIWINQDNVKYDHKLKNSQIVGVRFT